MTLGDRMAKHRWTKCAGLLLPLLIVSCARGPESRYSELSEAACPVVEADEETGSTRQLCATRVGGYALAILFDDDRISINVITPEGREFPLNFWDVISPRFTSHGEKAEWRVVKAGGKRVPRALIVRVDAYEDLDNPEVFTSYLAVAKIAPGQICVTDRIAPGPEQQSMARRAADAAANKPCLTTITRASLPAGEKEPSRIPAQFVECDIWGANLLDPLVLNEEGILTATGPTGPFPDVIAQVWNKTLNVKATDPRGQAYRYCLADGRKTYGLAALFHSETEGTYFSLEEFGSSAACREQSDAERTLPFPEAPFSRTCPQLKMGTSRDQLEQQLGPSHVTHGQILYYLQSNTPGNRQSCSEWLAAGEAGCCYPGMALTFSDGRLRGLVIADGGGEGPPCDEHPGNLRDR